VSLNERAWRQAGSGWDYYWTLFLLRGKGRNGWCLPCAPRELTRRRRRRPGASRVAARRSGRPAAALASGEPERSRVSSSGLCRPLCPRGCFHRLPVWFWVAGSHPNQHLCLECKMHETGYSLALLYRVLASLCVEYSGSLLFRVAKNGKKAVRFFMQKLFTIEWQMNHDEH